MKTHFLRYLKTQPLGTIVLDVGSNIGIHSLWLATLGYSVHSFEPLSKNFALLHCSVVLNPSLYSNIRINNFGLSTKKSSACMLSESHNLGGTHAEVLDGDQKYNGSYTCEPEDTASLRTLDWYWIRILHMEPVFMMKIDVEGFEPYVVAGGHRMFTQSPPKVLILEFAPHFIQRAGADARHFLASLDRLGYESCNPWTNACIPVNNVHMAFSDLTLVHKNFSANTIQVSVKNVASDRDGERHTFVHSRT
jgi:FkbM family methyltransferase